MKKPIHIFIILALFLLSIPALSQNNEQENKIKRKVNRLSHKIQEARNFANRFSNPMLNNIVKLAEDQLNLAKSAVNQRKYIAAQAHLNLGFTILERLFTEIRSNKKLRNKFKEILDKKIQDVERIVMKSGNAEAKQLLERAKLYRSRAYRLVESNEFQRAQKQYQLAIFFADNSLRMLSSPASYSPAELEKYFESTYSLLRQTREISNNFNNTQLNNFLEKAEKSYKKASNYYERKETRLALKELQMLNRLLYRILDMANSDPLMHDNRLEKEIIQLEESISQIRQQLAANPQPNIELLLERLVLRTTKARINLSNGRPVLARKNAAVANRLLLQIHRGTGKEQVVPAARIENQIQTAEIMFNALKKESADSKIYQQLLDVLEQNLKSAQQANINQQYQRTVQYLKFFNNLAVKLDREKNQLQLKEHKVQKLQNKLLRAERLLETTEPGSLRGEFPEIKYRNAKSLLKIARDAYRDKAFIRCNYLTNTAINLLTK